MGDNNADLFREKFELLRGTFSPSKLCDVNLICPENKHIFNSKQLEDHHALIPLGKLPENADDKERNIYTIVLEAFFTVCMPDFVYNEKALAFHCGVYVFKTKIREVLQPGWKAAKQKTPDDDSAEQEVSAFDHSSCSIESVSILSKFTEPPKEFSLDTLLSFMENPHNADGEKLTGLGTPATRAEIIKSLFDRQYISEEKKKLLASKRGFYLIDQMSKDSALIKITETSQTTEWEEKLNASPDSFENDIKDYIRRCIKLDTQITPFERESLGKCPLCGKNVTETKTAFSCSGWKDTPKCPFVIWKNAFGADFTPEDARLLLDGKPTPKKKCKKKSGETYEAAFVLEKGEVKFAPRDGERSPIGKCPLCGKAVYESPKSYSCEGWKDTPKCDFTIWKDKAGASITAEDAALLLLGQKTRVIKFKKKDGAEFEARLALHGKDVEFLSEQK
jgi:DNA topoisomerase-3